MKELLWKRKRKLIQFVFAAFLFILNHFIQIIAFSVILGMLQKGTLVNMKVVILIAVGAIIFDGLNFLISRFLRIGYMRDTILTVRKQAFEKIMNLSFKRYNQQSKEVYISNLVNDINTFEENFFFCFLNVMVEGGSFVFGLAVLIYIQPFMAAYMAAASVLIYVAASFFSRQTTKNQEKVSTERFCL